MRKKEKKKKGSGGYNRRYLQGTGRSTLSCCMIVKNEEQFLARCLDSVKPYVDEIIIVDTGSDDRTVEIARQYTDRIYFHTWENDFSKHRNQSISYAIGDWILQIDADEELAPGSGDAILREIASVPRDVNALMVNITDVDQKGRPRATFNFPRVFRNRVGIHYEGIVHNQVVGQGNAIASAAVFYHYGYYLNEEKMEAKRKRSIPLLLKQLEENPENVFAMYNLANMHVGMRDYPAVIRYGEEALKLLRNKDTVPAFYISLYSPLIHACIREKEVEKARRYAEESVRIFPKFLDGYYLLSEVAFLQEDWNTAVEAGLKALELYEELLADKARLGTIVTYYLNSRPHLALRTGAALIRVGGDDRARKAFRLALSEHPELEATLRFILKTTQELGNRELYDEFLHEALLRFPNDPLFNRLELERAMEADRPYSELLEIFERLSGVDSGEDWELRKGIFQLERAKFRDAEETFTELIRKRPPSAGLLAYRAIAREGLRLCQGAIEDHEAAVALEPGFVHSWVKLGEHLMTLGAWDSALERFQKAQEKGARGPEIWLRIAILGVRIGDLEISVEPLERLLEHLFLPKHRTLESLEDLAQLFEDVGRALDAKGERRLAAEAYGLAGELDPRRAELSILAGRRFLAVGDTSAAAFHLDAALRAAPHRQDLLGEVEGVLEALGLGGGGPPKE